MTQEFVTLPREVVERALAAMESGVTGTDYDRKAQALRAALDQPQVEQEPVAGVVIRDGLPCLLQDKHIKSTDHRVYTHPQPKHQPLTNEQVNAIASELNKARNLENKLVGNIELSQRVARAIEAAHNIK